jgi:hypothetical protein
VNVAKLTGKLHEARLIHSCLTCVHFNEDLEQCTLVYVRPPARVIAFGCPEWDDDAARVAAYAQALLDASGGTLPVGYTIAVAEKALRHNESQEG